MWQRAVQQRKLFDDGEAFQVPQLQEELRQEATRLLVQWMAALAESVSGEADDEQD
jgi:hypothetical protein